MKMQNALEQQIDVNQTSRRAYQLWERAGCPQGRDLEFWLQAEAELRIASQPERPESAAAPLAPPPARTAQSITAAARTVTPAFTATVPNRSNKRKGLHKQ
jgi:hypothetical protein